MSVGYLLASLPMLAPDRAPRITAEDFRSTCASALSVADAAAVAELLVGDGTPNATHPAVRKWYALAAAIDGAVGRCRLARRGRTTVVPPPPTSACPLWLIRAVEAAFESASDPLTREDALMRVRWNAAEDFGGFDPMAKVQVFAYAVRLRLALRRAARDTKTGRERLEAALPKETL